MASTERLRFASGAPASKLVRDGGLHNVSPVGRRSPPLRRRPPLVALRPRYMAGPVDELYLGPNLDRLRLVTTRLPAADSSSTNGTRPGGPASLDGLLPAVYDELREIARRQLSARESGNTLSTTGLVHEAYLKLADQHGATWRDRAHFIALASVVMRHVLVDRARARLAEKRDGHRQRVTLDSELVPADDQPEAMLQLNDAIERLALAEPRLARVVDCRFFGGMTDDEIANALEVTRRTVQRDWVKARMLLRRALSA